MLLDYIRNKATLRKDHDPTATFGDGCGFTQEQIDAAPEPELEEDDLQAEAGTVAVPKGLQRVVDEDLIRELRNHGVIVKKVKGWKTRGHPGTFDPRAHCNHHTGSNRDSGPAPALGIVTFGRSDLPGPLSNFVTARNGVLYIVAAGRCYHAGYGGPWHGIPKDSGNSYMTSNEIENDGRGEPYSEKQMRIVAILDACLLKKMKRTVFMDGSHKEWAPDRKIDPTFDMNKHRARVKARMRKWKKAARKLRKRNRRR